MKKAIVIPSYRAEKTLPSVLSRIPPAFWVDGIAIVVNDNNPDNTGQVAKELRFNGPDWMSFIMKSTPFPMGSMFSK